jgi:integrase
VWPTRGCEKRFQEMKIEKRRRLFYAVMSVPRPLRRVVGKDRFVQSLQTDNKATAERRAAVLKLQWLTTLEKARTGTGDHLAKDAEWWRRAIQNAPDEHQRELLLDLLADEAREKVERAATRRGIVDDRDPRYDDLPELAQQKRFVDMATGRLLPLDAHLDDWRGTLLRDEPKTVAGKVSAVQQFAQAFPFAQDVTRKGVQGWVNKLSQDGLAPPTLSRKLQKVRGYWSYLVSIQAIPEATVEAFDKLTMPRATAPKGTPLRPLRSSFEALEVTTLVALAAERRDASLVDLIELGRWTGARIEELGSLRVEDVSLDEGSFRIGDAKTPAGCRTVPIHSRLRSTVEKLVQASTDGFLLSGQRPDQFGVRSGALSKRFGRLRVAAGHGPEKVFHSLRKTVATQLMSAGVPEPIAAVLLGHELKTMSYGLYASAPPIEVLREAIERIQYPAVEPLRHEQRALEVGLR